MSGNGSFSYRVAGCWADWLYVDVDWCWCWWLLDVGSTCCKGSAQQGWPIASHCAIHSATAVRRIEKSKARGAVETTNGVWRRLTYLLQNCIRSWMMIVDIFAICLPLAAQCLMASIIWNSLVELLHQSLAQASLDRIQVVLWLKSRS